ncbi:uncharacterized protein LOC126674240 [Mercurialis annua]|uniref:uncharacterized protein LOC126674240 n=1 Tax=Mercurialis annua TaxID=3986 RepID=UPI00215EBB7E|nr:uncharacterized protein LOC126674240 [Mercurialis annua]
MANISFLHHNSSASSSSAPHHHFHRRSSHRNHLAADPYRPLFSSPSLSSELYHSLPRPNDDFNIIHDDEAVSDPESVILGSHQDLFDRENQVTFVMDLFQQRVEQSEVMGPGSHLVVSDTDDFGVIEDNCELGMDNLDFELGLGFGLENCGFQNIINHHNDNNNNNRHSGFVIDDDEDDFFIERRLSGLQSCEAESTVSFHSNAARIVGLGSDDSDSDDNENNTLVIGLNSLDGYGADLGNDQFDYNDEDEEDASVTFPLCWDSLQLEDHRENNEDFEWEEVDGRVDERDVLSMFVDDEESASVSLSISPIVAPEDMVNVERIGGLGNLEWEVLLNANSLDTNPDRGHDFHNAEPYFGDHDDYIYTAEYEMLFAQFAENDNALIGRPPAAKSVVEKLPSVVLTKEDADSNNALCAVCKDEINVGEEAKQLPCTHHYHGECILPWLGIRNTCPVCRFELPTDDADYERRKAAQRAVAASRRF